MPLRILQIASGLGCLAGTEKHVLDISAGLARRGHAVTLACRHDCPLTQRATELGLQRITLEMWSVHDWKQLPRFVHAMAGKFEVIHIHSPCDYLVPALAGRLSGIPAVVMTRHMPNPFASRRTAYICASVLYHRIIAVSDFIRRVLIESGARPERVDVVPNGIDPISPDPVAGRRLREALGIPQDAILIAAAGRMSAEKGFDILLKAVRELNVGGIAVYCAIFGEGSALEQLRKLASDLQIDSRVRLPGFRSDVHDLWRAADIAVIPSVWPEPFGYVALEALSAGCAVVASAAGALPEVLAGDSAILTRPGDAHGLAAAIRALAMSPGLRSQMGQAARHRASLFTLEASAAGVERVYASVLRRPLQACVAPGPLR